MVNEGVNSMAIGKAPHVGVTLKLFHTPSGIVMDLPSLAPGY